MNMTQWGGRNEAISGRRVRPVKDPYEVSTVER